MSRCDLRDGRGRGRRAQHNSTLQIGAHRLVTVPGLNRPLFRSVGIDPHAPDTPRALFRDLPRDADVKFLWAHQDRVLEEYETRTGVTDLALELPTGTGKTLIGLLIADWRRRHKHERALYVCPTRQLAHQVGGQAARYGISAKVCLKPD
jgi:Rad3-related DNA helicase